jgi:hypothetical protein
MSARPTLSDALEQLRKSAKEERLPNYDVEGIEERVIAEATRSDVSSAFISVRRHNFGVWVAIGVAASLSLFIASQKLHLDTTPSSGIPDRGQLELGDGIDGRKLRLGQQVNALNGDVTVKHPAVATWRLLAHGKAQIVENDDERITIALEDGLIQADVVPRQKPESFAIEVGTTRVAVHGTMFSVERRGDMAEVVVREGKVMVGSNRERGAMTGTLLTAPSRAKIGVSAGSQSEPEITTEQLTRQPPQRWPNMGAIAPATTAAGHQGNLPVDESASRAVELEKAWASVEAIASSCFAEHTAKSPSVRVSFKTQLSLTVGSKGKIGNIDFYPPVPEPVRACTLSQVVKLAESPTLEGATMSRPAILSR